MLARLGTEALGQRIRDTNFTLSFELPSGEHRGLSHGELGQTFPANKFNGKASDLDARGVLVATSATRLSALISSPTFWVSAKYQPPGISVTR